MAAHAAGSQSFGPMMSVEVDGSLFGEASQQLLDQQTVVDGDRLRSRGHRGY